jgi:alkylation response protein AidB-like acyl-CoA dehydrogenase
MQLRQYLNEVLPAYREQWGSEDSFAAALAWQQVLNDGGWAAPSWPHWAGGRGLETRDRVECDLELAAADAPMPAGILGLNNVGPALIHFGTEEQQRSLPQILSAEEIWCQGFSEPDAGSDLASLRTSARMDGEEFVVNGQKVWMSNGMEGTHCMVLVRTDPAAPKHQGISALLIPFDTPGVERRPLRQITAAEGFAEVFFTDVRVPVTALLGPLNEGWRVTTTTLGFERSGVISSAARLERQVNLLISQTSIDDPLLRDEMTRRWMEARLTGLLGARSLGALREGETPGPAQAIIKLSWSLAVSRLGETLLDICGAPGLIVEDPRHQFLRSRSMTIAAGTTEIMKDVLAERVLGLPRL